MQIDAGYSVQFVDEPAYGADVSPDVQRLAMWCKPENDTPWKVAIFPIGGGPPLKFIEIHSERPVRWTPDSKSVSYIRTAEGSSNIWTQALNGGRPK